MIQCFSLHIYSPHCLYLYLDEFLLQYMTSIFEFSMSCAKTISSALLFFDAIHFILFITHVSLLMLISFVIYIGERHICRSFILSYNTYFHFFFYFFLALYLFLVLVLDHSYLIIHGPFLVHFYSTHYSFFSHILEAMLEEFWVQAYCFLETLSRWLIWGHVSSLGRFFHFLRGVF